MDASKYKKMYFPVPLRDRKWPGRELTKPPKWCSVDLRDGNQALETPMSLSEKLDYFRMLVEIGFKEIEVAFPAASDTDFEFVRTLIENEEIPEGTSISVLTQSRPHIIKRTFEAIQGAKDVTVHLYNSTSELQRRVVFGMTKHEISDIALRGAHAIAEYAADFKGNISLEYSPESFMGTEPEFSAEICNAVTRVWRTHNFNTIINLPATVELSTPNVYADYIEYMCKSLQDRDSLVVSTHAHNDRGCAVAATELALLAGADRVEGTLFGNGERTGNADIVTLALNLFSLGIDPGLCFDNIESIVNKYEAITHMDVHPRQPYAGELVYTAFSGSHQDAIKKGMDYCAKHKSAHWENPYIPIDPADIGRHFEPVRITSQSGKSGVSFVLQRRFGVYLPKKLAIRLSEIITKISDKGCKEVTPQLIFDTFIDNFVDIDKPIRFLDYDVLSKSGETEVLAHLEIDGKSGKYVGSGNGPLDAMTDIINKNLDMNIEISGYHEHALQHGSSSEALAYVEIKDTENQTVWGAGSDTNISTASIKALISAVNRYKVSGGC